MAAKWQGYFKVVSSNPATTTMTDSQEIGAQGAYANYTWYQRLIQGSATRLTRYREYDLMDNDVEIARALDTISEEIIGNNPQEDSPLDAQFDMDKDPHIASSLVMTVKTALAYWTDMHRLPVRLFSIARCLVKYGDCFFIRRSPVASWEYVHPKNVLAAIVDEHDMTLVRGWQIKCETKRPNDPTGQSTSGITPYGQNTAQFDILDASQVIRFTLNDDMSESAPFGESVLRTIYRTQKQKELLEDSVIIYRIRNAPERRVFYIDVGKLPPQRVKGHLEQIKNEIRQKRVPSFGGGTDQVDSVYNPHSMNEDFFFSTRPDGKGSRVEVLPGGQGLGELSDLEYFQKKVWKGLRIPSSYMMDGEGGATYNDGATGVAYIAELRFSLFIKRMQSHVNEVMDEEFKKYLQAVGLAQDAMDVFSLILPAPENFGIYRQQKLSSELLGTYATADGIVHLSKRFALKKYLQLTDEELIENERMRFEEMGIDPDDPTAARLELLYNAPTDDGMGGMGGGGGGMPMAAGTLGGDDFDVDLGGDDGGMGGPPNADGTPPTGAPMPEPAAPPA